MSPFSGFDDWDDCIQTMTEEEGHDMDSAENICGALQAEEKADAGDPDALLDALERGAGLIADVGVDLVSGVDVPAVDSKWVMFKDGAGRKGHDFRADVPVLLSKADGDAEKRISYAAAMIPREPDKEGDVVPTATVEAAAHGFIKGDGGIDTDHSLIDGDGQPVESWVLKEERTYDLPSGGTETYPAGTWMLGVEWGADAWERIQDGELTGLSIYGMAEHVPLQRAAKCAECGTEKASDGDSDKREASDSADMGEDTQDGDAGGPTVADAIDKIESVSESVESLADAVETDKQDNPEEAAAELGDEFDMGAGDVMDLLSAAADLGIEGVMDAIDAAQMEGADTVENESDEDEEEDEEMESSKDADTSPDHDDAAMGKGYSGEGTREAQAKQATGDAGATGDTSWRAAKEKYGGES